MGSKRGVGAGRGRFRAFTFGRGQAKLSIPAVCPARFFAVPRAVSTWPGLPPVSKEMA